MKGNGPCTDFVKAAGADAYDRLIYPSVENETRTMLTDRAATAAIKVFAQNLRPLLMAPPIKNKVCIGLDPGYRTGCKVACVDGTGKVLDTGVIYVTHGDAQKAAAEQTIAGLIKKHNVDIISIGNGTASKETEIFAGSNKVLPCGKYEHLCSKLLKTCRWSCHYSKYCRYFHSAAYRIF